MVPFPRLTVSLETPRMSQPARETLKNTTKTKLRSWHDVRAPYTKGDWRLFRRRWRVVGLRWEVGRNLPAAGNGWRAAESRHCTQQVVRSNNQQIFLKQTFNKLFLMLEISFSATGTIILVHYCGTSTIPDFPRTAGVEHSPTYEDF